MKSPAIRYVIWPVLAMLLLGTAMIATVVFLIPR